MPEVPAPIRFVLDGKEILVEDAPASTTVLQYLREDLGRCASKEGCAEGDCGACTVILGELDPAGALQYRPINACIRFLASVDGREIVTVDGLAQPDGSLHPVQQAMVDAHASQCGFCTPGFVMSLFGLWLQNPDPDRESVLEALSGNLCRCTGYRPIVDAALRMGSYPQPEHWPRTDAGDPERRALIQSLQRKHGLVRPGWQAPRTLDELAQALEHSPDALLLAGGTDIALWSNKQLRTLPEMIWLGEVSELRQVNLDERSLAVGAAVSLADAYRAITTHWPTLNELALRFASPPVRHSGTLCGNIGNGSPIGDSMPWLLALDASLVLRKGRRERVVPLDTFYTGYRQNGLDRGEFIQAVRIPLPEPGQLLACYKFSRRFEQDISAVCAAISVNVQGGQILTARLAYGGMAATPARAQYAEEALTGQAFSRAAFEQAMRALNSDFSPMSDHRAGQDYRKRVAAHALLRFWLEHGEPASAVRIEEVSAV